VAVQQEGRKPVGEQEERTPVGEQEEKRPAEAEEEERRPEAQEETTLVVGCSEGTLLTVIRPLEESYQNRRRPRASREERRLPTFQA